MTLDPRTTTFVAKNQADAERHLIVCAALVEILQTDPRVERIYQEWRRTSGLTELMRQRAEAVDNSTREEAEATILLTLGWGAGKDLGDRLQYLGTRDLRLPYPCLLHQLHGVLLVRFCNEAAPGRTPARLMTKILPPQGPVPRGQRADNGGESLRRGIQWYYRVHIQDPPEKVSHIAKEYASDRRKAWSDNTSGINHVKAALAKARTALEQAEYVFATS